MVQNQFPTHSDQDVRYTLVQGDDASQSTQRLSSAIEGPTVTQLQPDSLDADVRSSTESTRPQANTAPNISRSDWGTGWKTLTLMIIFYTCGLY
jgi:hypothetical protein